MTLLSAAPAVAAFVAHLGASGWLRRRAEARGLLALQGAMSGLAAAIVLVGWLARHGAAETVALFTVLEVGLAGMGAVYFVATMRNWASGGRTGAPFGWLATVGPLFGTLCAVLAAILQQGEFVVLGVPPVRWPQMVLAVLMVVPAARYIPRHLKQQDPNGLFRELPWLLTSVFVVVTAVIWVLSPAGRLGDLSLGGHAVLVLVWAWSADRAQCLRLHPDNAGAASVRSLQEALLLLNERGVVDYANPAAVELLGLDPQGVALSSIVEDPKLQAGGARMRKADGSWVEVVLSLAPIQMGGGVVGMAVSATDVGELKQALAAAHHAAQARQDFLAVMSHEIRTPMNAVVGLAHLLESSELNAEQRRWARTMRTSADALSVMLSDILDLSRIEAGAVELEEVNWDPGEVLRATLDLVEEQAKEKGIALESSLSRLPRQALGDPTRVRQVLLNLLSNAIKFTSEGHVRLVADWNGTDFVVQVEDTGIGIPQEKLETLFDAFVQADTSTTRRFGGSGLGLTISKRLAEMMGGSLQVESQPGVGSCFTLRMPLSDVVHQADPGQSAAPGPELSELRVLVVEDNAVNRMVLRAVLARIGVVPEEREDGQQGLQAVLEGRFDVVIMDLQMPVMDGWEAMERIRELLGDSAPWLIAHSANVQPVDVARAKASGADDHLPKPAPPASLEAALHRAHAMREARFSSLGAKAG